MAKKTSAIAKAYTKAELVSAIAEENDLTKKDVAAVFDSLVGIVERHVKTRGAGEFTLPGLLKIKRYKKKASKKRTGRNPQTGEAITIKAKPAHNAIKVMPLKPLKDMV